jgi:CO/xanthine dehydrogenase Mo-binding subunit
MSLIGSKVERTDGTSKVTGEAMYTVDYAESGMLHGSLLRASVPAGKITNLDVSLAATMPGVRAIVTAAEAPKGLAGMLILDQPLFAAEDIRFEGEPIAAVAADTVKQARAAVAAIELEIEELPGLTDMAAALVNDAPLIHPEWESYALTPMAAQTDLRRSGNIAGELIADPDGVDSAFEMAHLVVEDEIEVNRQYQAYLEPMSAVASYRDGRYTVHTGSQFPFNIREELSQYLQVPSSAVRVIGHTVGGGFGAKLGCGTEPYAAVLSKAAGGRAVKVVKQRSEDILTAPCRENAQMRIRSAIDKDGNIIGREFFCDLDCGAYGVETPFFPSIALHFGAGVYRIGPIRVVARAIYTNTAPTGAFRGISGPNIYMAIERHMDHIANELGEDRRAFRLRHLMQDGDALPNGQVLDDANILQEAFDAVEKKAPWDKLQKGQKSYRGVGIAAAIWLTNPLPGHVTLNIDEDGTVQVVTAANDNGSGAVAMGITQIVAEELGVKPEDVRIAFPDTDTCGYDAGSQGSRTTHIVGRAASNAAVEVRARLFEVAAALLEANVSDLELVGGTVGVTGSPDTRIPLGNLVMAATYQGMSVTGTGSYMTPPVPFNPGCAAGLVFPSLPTPTYHVHQAEVEVDPVTGNVTVLRYVVAQEVGKAINPVGIIGQVQGGVVQGLGLALYESLRLKEGRYQERTLESYRVPLAVDVPRVETILLEHADAAGPFGAKGVGEPPVALVPAVIANAVSDAIGKPFNNIPITPEDVLAAITDE